MRCYFKVYVRSIICNKYENVDVEKKFFQCGNCFYNYWWYFYSNSFKSNLMYWFV